jgi:SAM-dependent methyltransferase
MPDVYATIADVDAATQERLADILELRAADPQQRDMAESYLSDLVLPPSARVLGIGCGTGPITRMLADLGNVAEAVGLDPSPVFIARAGELAAGLGNVRFEVGDGRARQRSTLGRAPSPARDGDELVVDSVDQPSAPLTE